MGILILLLCNTILDPGSTGIIVFIYYLYNSLFSVMFFIELSILVIMFLFKSYAWLINCLLMVFYICWLAILYPSDTFSGYYNCMNIVIEIVNLPIYLPISCGLQITSTDEVPVQGLDIILFICNRFSFVSNGIHVMILNTI